MKWLYRIAVGLLTFVASAEFAAIITIAVLIDNVSFRLRGDDPVVLNLGDTYSDKGVEATTINWDLSDYVSAEQSLDTSHIGTYYITYNLDFLNRRYTLEREIRVIDDIPPSIALNGDAEVRIYVGDEYADVGATASDNYDGDITDKITVQNTVDTSSEGEYEIVYSVNDSSDNTASIRRKVIVEKKPTPAVMYTVYNTPNTPAVPYTSSDPIADFIEARGYDVSVGYYNLVTGQSYFYQGDRLYYGASLIKTLDAIYLYDKNMVDDNLKYYIDRAILASDNNAHRYLVDYIGREVLREYGISLGATNTLSSDGYYFGDTTVVDQLVYFKKAYQLANQNGNFKAPFVNDSYNYVKVNGIPTMHKNGYYGQWFHDAGIVLDDEPYIVVILTNHGRGNQYGTVHSLAEEVYKFHKHQL